MQFPQGGSQQERQLLRLTLTGELALSLEQQGADD